MPPDREALVGRDAEIEAIVAVLAGRDALPAAIVIEGEPGSGKTSVWRAGVDEAERRGFRVARCRPAGAEVQLSFAALGDLLDGVLGETLPGLPEPQRRALEVALLLRDDDGRAPDQRAIAAGTLGAIRILAEASPLLLAIDDAQWLDAPSAAVLQFAARRLANTPVVVLTAWRTSLAAASDTSVAASSGALLTAGRDRPALQLKLGPLSLGAIQRIVRIRTGSSFTRRTLQRIHDTAGGNPFYAIELAGSLERGDLDQQPGEPLPLSASLDEILAGQLAGLAPATRDALFVGAAAAQPTIELISAVIGQAAEPVLEAAVAARVIRLEGERVVFAHPLLAAAAYARAAPASRRAWHGRLADISPDAEASARHLALARNRPDLDVARRLGEAARQARQRGAGSAAAELFGEAIEWFPPDAAGERARLIVEASSALRAAGEGPLVRALLESALEALPSGGPRCDALLQLSALVTGDPAGSDRELDLIEAAIAEAGHDAGRRAAALLHREMWERHRERLAGALPFAREAARLAEVSGDRHLLARALTRTADLEVLLGLADDPIAHFARALEVGRAFRFDNRDDSAPAMLAACLIRAGRVDEARTLLIGERDQAIAEGDEASLEILYVLLAELEWLAGEWALARRYAAEGLEIAEHAGSRAMQGALATLIALVDASTGLVEEARSRASAALALCEQVGDVSYARYADQVLGFVELSSGDAKLAHEHLSRAAAAGAIEGSKRLAFVGDAIEAPLHLGHVDAAAGLVDRLAERGRMLGRPTLIGVAARGRAMVLGSSGKLEAAVQSGVESVLQFERLGLPFERARSLLVLGEIQRRAKQRGAARATLREAIEVFGVLGAPGWVAKASAELARIGGRTATAGLTETELQVARLVAQGMTNKEIAARLFVTVRAVEANLSRIYAKLEIRSRTELARRI